MTQENIVLYVCKTFHLIVSFTLLHLCLRQPVDMKKAGVEPNVAIYTMYVMNLMVEGKYKEAKRVVKEMRQVGIQPDERTFATLDSSKDRLKRFRPVPPLVGVPPAVRVGTTLTSVARTTSG